MANETSKALRRRWREDARGEFAWKKLFDGRGIDVGCGPDPLPFADCIAFDEKQGDANVLHTLYPPNRFDYLHSSHCLEHMRSPEVLWRWAGLVRSGGAIVITVPSWELYEGMRWPSVYNPDHKSTWSMSLRGSSAPTHVHVPSWLSAHTPEFDILLTRQLDVNYDYKIGVTKDQTWIEADGVEPWIEFVLRKK